MIIVVNIEHPQKYFKVHNVFLDITHAHMLMHTHTYTHVYVWFYGLKPWP